MGLEGWGRRRRSATLSSELPRIYICIYIIYVQLIHPTQRGEGTLQPPTPPPLHSHPPSVSARGGAHRLVFLSQHPATHSGTKGPFPAPLTSAWGEARHSPEGGRGAGWRLRSPPALLQEARHPQPPPSTHGFAPPNLKALPQHPLLPSHSAITAAAPPRRWVGRRPPVPATGRS